MTADTDVTFNREPFTTPDEWPCPNCENHDAVIITRGAQHTVRCTACDTYIYNVSKSHLGLTPGTLRSRPTIKPSTRAWVLTTHGRACVLCKATDRALELGHLLSVRDGGQQGVPGALINHRANLAPMCAEDNSGLGGRSAAPDVIGGLVVNILAHGDNNDINTYMELLTWSARIWNTKGTA